MTVPDADFKLKLDKFWIEYYPSGQIRQYNSLLSVWKTARRLWRSRYG